MERSGKTARGNKRKDMRERRKEVKRNEKERKRRK